jgi:hypothetical protein
VASTDPHPSAATPTAAYARSMSEPLPEQTSDDTDRGWGERPVDDDPEDVGRFLEDRPPHHGDV